MSEMQTRTVTPTSAWQRAMQRAINEGLKPTRLVDGTYRVRSVSEPGKHHIVKVDQAGRICECTECLGWENGGRQRPCKHAGSVALAILFLRGYSIKTQTEMPVEAPRAGKSRMFRTEVAA